MSVEFVFCLHAAQGSKAVCARLIGERPFFDQGTRSSPHPIARFEERPVWPRSQHVDRLLNSAKTRPQPEGLWSVDSESRRRKLNFLSALSTVTMLLFVNPSFRFDSL